MLTNPTLGEGVLSPHEIDADALFEKIEKRVADLIVNGPSLDDLDWYALLSGEGE